MKIEIPGSFITLNQYINLERGNKFAAAKIKREETCKRQKLKPIQGAVDIVCHWYCKNTRTDPDNVAYSVKEILDGLVIAKVLENDSWAIVRGLRHIFRVDVKNPRVIVELYENKNNATRKSIT